MTQTFEGNPCRICGQAERYLSTRKCVSCCRKNSRRTDALRRAASTSNGAVPKFTGRYYVSWWEADLQDTRKFHLPPMPWSGSESGFIPEISKDRLMAGR